MSDQLASAGLIHSAGYGHHTSEQEDGYPVDRSIGLFFSQATGQYANQGADNCCHFQGDTLDTQSHYQNNGQQDNAGDDHLVLRGFVSFDFLLDFLISRQFLLRQQIFAYKHHVEHTCYGNGNTDPSEFEEAKGLQTCSSQSAGSDNVRRSAYHGDDTAPTASKCQRHQLTGSRNLSRGADTQCYGEQASCSTGVGQYGGQAGTNGHQAKHQAVFTGTNHLNNGVTDSLSKTGVEHGCTNYEHASEQNYGGVRQTAKYLLSRDQA